MLMVNQLVGLGVLPGGFTAAATVKSYTLGANLTGSNASYRNLVKTPAVGGTQVRVRFLASSAASFIANHCSIGIQSSGGDTTATPIELLFSGVSGFTITAGNSLVSDWADLTFTTSNTLVVVIDHGAASAMRYDGGSGDDMYDHAATFASYNSSSASGFTLNSLDIGGMDLVEARSAL